MATYKLMQDIEAEDKILGPLTLRQFVFALITAFLIYINFICLTKGVPFLCILFLPPALLTGFFAFPFGGDQPTEVWALAKIRFLFKPRLRIWNQSGVKDLVTITVPKKIVHVYTDGLSQTEVKSRLKILADTIDSRGWAIKNVNNNSFVSPMNLAGSDDRLIDIGSAPQYVPEYDLAASDDMLDASNNPIARQFDDMINQSSQAHRQALVAELNSPPPTVILDATSAPTTATPTTAAPATATITNSSTPWFMPPTAAPPVPVAATETPEEKALAAQIRAKSTTQPLAYGNLRTIQPLGSQQVATPAPQPAAAITSQPAPDPSMLALAHNNDLDVATIARQASKAKGGKNGSDEVVISLH